jgi:hypothetical protein
MRPFRSLFIAAVLSASADALETGRTDDSPAGAGATPREAALERLLSERESPELLEAAAAAARKAGVSEQAVLEARFLYHVDRREDDAIAALLPEFMKRRDAFRLEESEIFSVREDWLAVTEYVQAIAALKKDDKEAFKKHITEAFWLSPRQGAAFAPHIDRLRLEEAMKSVRIDSTTRLDQLAGGGTAPLASPDDKHKAVLLHFWSPWSRECEAFMPDFVATAVSFMDSGIRVVSILPEDSPKVVNDARELLKPLGAKPPGAWLIDRKKDPLSRRLRVQSVPSMVLLDTEGRVLFNGHPADESFWNSLLRVDPSIKRPSLEDAPH